LGTSTGHVLIWASTGVIQQVKTSPEESIPSPVISVIHLSRGLIAGNLKGTVELFDRVSDGVRSDVLKSMVSLACPEEDPIVRSYALSGSEGGLIVQLESNQLLKMPISWSELQKVAFILFPPASE
jgi:hypothetical protein